MSRYVLTTRATITCPHGGTVTVRATATRVTVDGDPPLRLGDRATVANCPHMNGNTPSPCMRVTWSKPSKKVRVQGAPVLAHDSVGLCLSAANVPQGTVSSSGFQTRVSVK